MATLLQDLRYGLRMLAKNPGFTGVAVLTLALGIGANAAVFSLVSAVLLRPLPYPQHDRLVRVTGYYPKGAFVAFAERTVTMDVAAFTTDTEFNLTGQSEAVHLEGSAVSAGLFAVLGASAQLGRTFRSGEDQPGHDRLVILSHGLWQRKFGGDPNVVGRFITLDAVNREIVGVMPAQFSFPSSGVQIWTPLHLDPANSFDYWNTGFMPLIGRLRPAATVAQARNEVRPLISGLILLFPYTMARNWNADAAVIALQRDLVGDVRGRLVVLQCAVGFVLLITCANVASLLLARATARRKEIALRAALGAERGRLVRQLLTESVVLACAGGGLGIALAFESLSWLKSALPADTPRLAEVGIDGRVLACMVVLAIVTGLASGLAPALSAAKFDLSSAIKTGGQRVSGAAGVRLRSSLIVGEVALSVVLAVGAALLIKSLWRMSEVDPGFHSEQILTVRATPNQALCSERSACIALYDEVLRRAHGITGVSAAAAASALPLTGQIPAVPVEVEGHPLKPAEDTAPMFWAGAVTPEYFQAMKIPVLEGRAFTDADGQRSTGVVLVSAATARRYWPNQDAVGKHVRVIWDRDWRTVVGVVGDVRQYDLANHSPSWLSGALYMPYPQAVGLDRRIPLAMTLLVRTTTEPSQVARYVRRLVTDLNPNVPVGEVQTMQSIVSDSTSTSRSLMWLFITFAGMALGLAAIGTYGVVSYSTAQKTFEMGIRVALGATRGRLFGMVMGQSLRLVLVGLALGIAASLALTRFLAAFLYGITPTDPASFLAVGGLLILMSLLAGYAPAQRVTRADPLAALRAE